MADITPYHFPGTTVTAHAENAITGGRAVQISGPRVDGNYQVGTPAAGGAAGAGAAIFGVATRDAAAGEKVMVWGDPGTIVEAEAGAALTAGDDLEIDAAGRFIVLAAGVKV